MKTQWLDINGSIEINETEDEFMETFILWLESKDCSFAGVTGLQEEDEEPTALEIAVEEISLRKRYESFLKSVIEGNEFLPSKDGFEVFCENLAKVGR